MALWYVPLVLNDQRNEFLASVGRLDSPRKGFLRNAKRATFGFGPLVAKQVTNPRAFPAGINVSSLFKRLSFTKIVFYPCLSSYGFFFFPKFFPMPTPRDSTAQVQLDTDPHLERASHTTCPTENERIGGRRELSDTRRTSDNATDNAVARLRDAPPSATGNLSHDGLTLHDSSTRPKTTTRVQESSALEGSSPLGISSDVKEAEPRIASPSMSLAIGGSSSVNCGIPNIRVR